MACFLVLFFQHFIQVPVFAGEILVVKYSIGQTQQGRNIAVEQFGIGAEKVVLMATIHGTEMIGTPLMHLLTDELISHPNWLEGRTLYIIQLANPDGFVEGIRGNRENVDINRNFPTENFGRGWFNGDQPLVAPETAVLMDFFTQIRPERVMTIHQPLKGIDYDGPADDLATHLSKISGIRVHRLGSRSGSLGTFVGVEMGCPIITLEIPNQANDRDSQWLWDHYGVLLETFIRYEPSTTQSN